MQFLIRYYDIRKKCKKAEKELMFDMSKIDEEISKLADDIYCAHKNKFNSFQNFSSKVGFFASVLYDLGGHTPCLVNLAQSLYENEKFPLFISRLQTTKKQAPKTLEKLDKTTQIDGVNFHSYNFVYSLINLYNKIISNCPKIVFIYIHQHDILFCTLIHLLKKNTNMKFVFFDHATHFPNLAMTKCDLILELLESTKIVLNKKRNLYNCKIVGLQSKKKEDIKYYSIDEKKAKKEELKIPKDKLISVSGGSSYKFFEDDNSKHYQMIKELLEEEENLYHLAITNLNEKQQKIVDKIFENSNAKNRLIIHKLTPEFDLLFQLADVFIDSFPISSAMTQLDLMSMKIPSVVKINTQNIAWTFHEYMPKNYKYMFKEIEDMKQGILDLLRNEEKRKQIAQENYDFWLKTYENSAVKSKYIEIINELDNDNNAPKNILVLGGSGFIGSNLLKKLSKTNNKIYSFDFQIPNEKIENIEYLKGDFSKIEEYEHIFDNIDTIYHLISSTTPNANKDEIINDINANIISTIKMLNICTQKNIKKVIFTSSGGAIYGMGDKIHGENDSTKPIYPYGINKLTLERYFDFYYRFYNIDYTILRISNPYGSNHKNKKQGLINVILDKINSNEQIDIYGDGEILRDYIYIDDVIEALFLSLNYKGSEKCFNICSSNSISINEIINKISKILKIKPKINYTNARAFDILISKLDNTKAKKYLNWKPRVDIDTGLKKLIHNNKTI